MGVSSWCAVVCSVWFWYFLIVLSYFFECHAWPRFGKKQILQVKQDPWQVINSFCWSCMNQNWIKKSKWVWPRNATITHCRSIHGTLWKVRKMITSTWHPEDYRGPSKAFRSFFPSEMIAILDCIAKQGSITQTYTNNQSNNKQWMNKFEPTVA